MCNLPTLAQVTFCMVIADPHVPSWRKVFFSKHSCHYAEVSYNIEITRSWIGNCDMIIRITIRISILNFSICCKTKTNSPLEYSVHRSPSAHSSNVCQSFNEVHPWFLGNNSQTITACGDIVTVITIPLEGVVTFIADCSHIQYWKK